MKSRSGRPTTRDNVVSELMRGPAAHPGVVAWVWGLREQPVTTVLTRAEILAGLALLPAGARREALTRAATAALATVGMVLPVTEPAADRYAAILAACQRAGRPVATTDALIAAVALSVGARVATRNVQDFAHTGVDVVDPRKE